MKRIGEEIIGQKYLIDAKSMQTAIVIGAYKLTHFVRLGILRCRRIWGDDVPILVSDDYAPESKDIQAMASEMNCDYICPKKRRSHFSGDMSVFVNGLVYGRETGADVVLKLSQRFIVVLPEFKEALDRAFMDPSCQIALPGRIPANQISRPGAVFYKRFGILTDCLAFRPTCMEPEDLVSFYRERCKEGRKPHDSFSECTWGALLDQKFANAYKIIPEWTAHRDGQKKVYLRKAQSSESDYRQIAMMEKVHSPNGWPLLEWRLIENGQYRPMADCV